MSGRLLTRSRSPYDGDVFALIIAALRYKGYIVLDNVFDNAQLESLFFDIKRTDSQYFHDAGIGREQVHQLNRFVRGDRIRWLDRDYLPVRFYFDWIEQLRQRINRELFLGLFEYECHFSHYPKGSFYKKHLDAFKGEANRVLTTILYLNPAWRSGDGGELVLYQNDGQTVLGTVQPAFGTMVLFLSEDFPHEVLPTNHSRYSLSGWYRINRTDSTNLDPLK